MLPYAPSEKAYLLHLCVVYEIIGVKLNSSEAWRGLTQGMVAEAPRHLEGGDLFNGDPWPVRQYTSPNIPHTCRRWLKTERAGMLANATAREKGVDERMTLRFILDDLAVLKKNS